MNRLFRWLDTVLGAAFVTALLFGVMSALPTSARASEWVVASGPLTSEKRAVSDFNALAVSGGMKVKLRQGTQESVEVKAEANLLPLLETVVEGKTLHIRWKKGSSIRTKQSPTIEVTAIQLQALSTSGSGDIAAEGLKSPQLAVAIAGSGDVGLASLEGDELTVKIAGSGDFKAHGGQVGKLRVSVSGSGDVRTMPLKADEVNVSIAGSGDAQVHAGKTLNVSIAGSGDVAYSGDAQVKSSVAGSGSVRKR